MELTTIKIEESSNNRYIFSIKGFFCAFFVLYFATSVIDGYFLIYLPLLYFNILDIDTSILSIIQFGIYGSVLITPFTGFISDKYIKKRQQMVILIISFSITANFIFFISFFTYLWVYLVFAIMYFVSQAFLRSSMSAVFFKILSKIPDKKTQNSFLLVANSSTIFGYLLIGIIFNIVIVNVYDLLEWARFFSIGAILVSTILAGPLIIKFTHVKDLITEPKKFNLKDVPELIPSTRDKSNSINKIYIIPILLIYLTGFLSSSDQLFAFPFSSWIFNSFGNSNFKVFTALYSSFQILILLGYFTFQWLLNSKLKRLESGHLTFYERETCYNLYRKRILISCTISFMVLYLTFTVVDFVPFMLFYGFFSFLAGIYNISLTNFNIEVSKRLKNQTFFYLLTGTSVSLAQFILKPLGIALTTYIPVEGLMIITAILTLFSLIPLYYTKLPIEEIKKKNE